MVFAALRRLLRLDAKASRGTRSRRKRSHLDCELLEDRRVLATITVTDLGDPFVQPGSPPPVGPGGAKTLRRAIYEANNGDTINFATSLFASGPGIINIGSDGAGNGNGAFQITKQNLTLLGPGANLLTIDGMSIFGDKQEQIFLISIQPSTANFGFTLQGVTVADGLGLEAGGIYHVTGNLTVNNCTFTKNTAQGIFIGDGGGAIHSQGGAGLLTVNYCDFNNNVAPLSGGAVLTQSSAAFTGCSFENNVIAGSGGAVDVRGTTSTFTGCLFQNNRVTFASGAQGGGAIMIETGAVTIDSSEFDNNSTITGPGGDATTHRSGGGAIYNASALTITNSTFTGNSVDYTNVSGTVLGWFGGGGAIFNDKTLTLTDVTFDRNISKTGTTTSSTVPNFNQRGGGGALFDNGSSTITNCTFAKNTALTFSSVNTDGGAVYFNGTTERFIHATLATNSFGSSRSPTVGHDLLAFNTGATIANSIVGGSFGVAAIAVTNNANVSSRAASLVTGIVGLGTYGIATGDLLGVDPLFNFDPVLGGLQFNNTLVPPYTITGNPAFPNNFTIQPPKTLALTRGSPPRDRADPTFDTTIGLTTDQRNYARSINLAPDMGAFEYQLTSFVTLSPVTPLPTPADGIVRSAIGQPVTLMVTVTTDDPQAAVAPTGLVQLLDNGLPILLPNGTVDPASIVALTNVSITSATGLFTINSLGLGLHSITVQYLGDLNYAPSPVPPLLSNVVPVLISLAQANVTVASSLNPSNPGNTVTFTISVSSSGTGTQFGPTGTVDLFDGTTLLARLTLDANGKATFTTATLLLGVHPIIANYSGDANNTTGTGSLLQVVGLNTNVNLVSSKNPSGLGDPVQFSAQLVFNGPTAPTGSFSFYDGGTLLGTVTADALGRASLTVTTLSLGVHNITAIYNGDSTYLPSTSNVLQQRIKHLSVTTGVHYFAVGADAGGTPLVNVYNANTGQLVTSFFAYDPGFTGGVRVAVGDVNGDGVPDIICAPGAGGGPNVRVFNGTGFGLIRSFFATTPTFGGGLYVATGDVNGDGYSDIIIGAGETGGPQLQVFSGFDTRLLYNVFTYNLAFTGGVRVGAGDVNNDGFDDIIVGAGVGGGPHVKVISGANLTVLYSFFAYDPSFTGGIFVAGGDVNGDNHADIIVGPGLGGGPNLRAFSGIDASLLLNTFAFPPNSQSLTSDGNGDWVSGLRVGSFPTSSGRFALIAGPGPGQPSEVKAYDYAGLTQIDDFFAFDRGFLGGVWVAGG